MVPEVKICGLTRRADAEAADGAGVRYLGAVFAPASPRVVSAAQAAALWDGLVARRVGVFVDAPLRELVSVAEAAGLHVLQLHGDETPEQLRALRSAGAWTLWKAVRVRDGQDFRRALDGFAEHVDGLLVDAWSAAARGGTGTVFPWEVVAQQRDQLPPGVRFIAAGGLRPDNLRRAVELLRPDAVDLSSGVETAPGVKDAASIHAVMHTIGSMA
jgi:phosphoribosylanthranilate isomerase